MLQQIQVGAPVQFVDPTGYARQLQQQFIATKYAPVTLNSASGTAPQTVLTVPAGNYVFITGIQITIDPICTTGSGGMVNITLTDSVDGTIATLRAYIPASATAPTIATVIRQTSAPGNFWASDTQATTITASISTALTAGSVRISFNYGYSTVPIGNQ